MKSKVILFCVLLFCSKIVDSIPHSKDLVRQRETPLSNWKVNQNAQNGQYLDIDFKPTRNVNIQQEKAQDYYANQGGYKYDNNEYNRSPASSPSGEEVVVSYDSPADGLRLNSYPPGLESYLSHSSPLGFEHQQYQNQNWRSQNQYTDSVRAPVVVNENPLVTTVQEPYRGPVQYPQPKYGQASNRRRYESSRPYLTREQYLNLIGDKTYIANSAPPFGSSGPVPYENYSEDKVVSERKARPPGGQRYWQSIEPQSQIIYNKSPAVIQATETLTDLSENIEYADKYKSRSDVSNTAPIRNYDDGSQSRIISNEAPTVNAESLTNQFENIRYGHNNKLRSDLSHTPPITNYDDSSSLIPEADNNNSDDKKQGSVYNILSKKPLARRYPNNHGSDSRWNNIPRDDSSNSTPVVTETVEVKSGKMEPDYVPRKSVRINSFLPLPPSAPTGTELLNGNNKYEESNAAHHGSRIPTPSNTYLKQNIHKQLNSSIKEYNLLSPKIQHILKENSKRYVIVHPNKTVEYVDEHDIGSHQNVNLRLVTKHKNMDEQPPENLSNNIAKTPVPVDEYLLPTNNQPADDKKPTPLHVDQANPAYDYDANMSPPLKDLPADDSNLKPLPQPEKKTADNNDNNDSKPAYVIPPADYENSTPLTPSEDQSAQNDDSKQLTPRVNQSAADGNSKSLLEFGDQPADDYNSKLLTSKKDQTADDNYSKLDQPKDDNNFTPLFSNAAQPVHVKKTKLPYLKHLANDNNFKPHNKSNHSHNHYNNANPSTTSKLPENQQGDDNDSRPLPAIQSENDTKSKPLHGDQGRDDFKPHNKSKHLHNHYNNANPSPTSKLSENQQGDDNDSRPTPAIQSENDTKSKPLHGDQGRDDNDSNLSSPDENQSEEDKKSKPGRRNENQTTDDLKSEPNPAVASKNDDLSNSTTVFPIVSNYITSTKKPLIKTHKRKHKHHKSRTDSLVVSTTPSLDDSSKDQMITLSPIEQATDNVSDVPPVASTTTTTRPVKSSGKSDNINDAYNKQDDVEDDTIQTYSTTTVSPSSSASPTDNITDDKTIRNKNTQTNDKTIIDQVNGKKDTQTAVYNSSELFDTNTDVPAESDDYSSVTESPSVQNDVNTGDVSGDNSLELEQSETDVTITVSSSTANDSEDEIIAINIEVSESTDDADSSSNDKTLVVSIDTNDDSDDDSKTPKPEVCKKDHNSNDGRGNNVEIDMSNLKGEPTMWIRTTNQDFIDKLTAKNDTEFEVIYFFRIEKQPVIERNKITTIYCNGTVVKETNEITYENKDDPTPTIVRTTVIMQKEDYEAE